MHTEVRSRNLCSTMFDRNGEVMHYLLNNNLQRVTAWK